jgi:hypothetical protein
VKPTRVIWILFGLAACGGDKVGTSVGNPPNATLELIAYDGSAGAKRTAAAGVTLEKAFIVVDRVRLRDAATCEGDERVQIEGPLIADLLGGGVLPAPAPLPLAGRRFCRYEMRWKQLNPSDPLPAGADPALAGLSMLVEGRTAAGKRFRIDGEFLEEFRLDGRGGGFELPAATESLFVTFDYAAWIDAAAIDAVAEDPVVISRALNKELYMAFREAVRRSARLFRDADGDGALGAGERKDEQALAGAQ